MNNRMATAGAVLAIVGLFVWIGVTLPRADAPTAATTPSALPPSGSEGPPPQSPAGSNGTFGSDVPCAVPLAWRLARVDEGFGMDTTEVLRVIEEAAAMWSDGVGRTLFNRDPEAGFPIRLIYDERQERSQERQRVQDQIDANARRLDARRERLLARAEAVAAERREFRDELAAFERRVARHNDTVSFWNDQGGADPDVASRLQREAEALVSEQRRVEERGRELDGRARALVAEEEELDSDVAAYRKETASIAAAFPTTSAETGLYREAIRREDGEIVAIGREIRVFRFASPNDLRIVLAHEMGHALGLGHSEASEGVMREERGADRASGTRELHASDLRMLRARCPALTEGRRDR